MAFDEARVRAAFPILSRKIRTLDGKEGPLAYFDHGASTHAPKPVIDAVVSTLSTSYANVHRGNHTLSRECSEAFDDAMVTLQRFVGAHPEETCVVLGQNTTMALDLAAHVMAGHPGSTLTTMLEHHSNELPHRRRGTVLHAEVDAQGRLLLDDVEQKLQAGNVKLLAVSGASNVTGTAPPLGKLARMAHDAGARILVDAAQLYAHRPITMRRPGHPEHLDLIAAAGHKAYAPLGSAFLIASRELLDAAPPYMPGGGTVEWVTETGVLHNRSPDRHMGGTPNIVGAIAFAAATDFLSGIGMENVQEHEEALTRRLLRRFADLEGDHGVRLLGPKKAGEKVGVFSFTVPRVRHELASAVLNHEWGIATRNGCFCAQPLLNRLLGLGAQPAWTQAIARGEKVDVPGATRATLGVYNTRAEVDLLGDALEVLARRTWKGRYVMEDHRTCLPLEAPAHLAA